VERGYRAAALALLGMTVLFGGTWPAGKVAAEHVAPATAATVRFAVAAALLWAWAAVAGRRVRLPARRDLPLLAGLGVSAVFAYNLFFLYGLRLAPATDGSILVPGLIPIVTTLLAWPLLGSVPTWRTAAGYAVAICGLVLVVDPAGAVGARRLEGDALLVGAACAWAAYTILSRFATARFDSVTANVYATATGALMLLPLSFLGGGWGRLARAPVQAWGAIAYLSLLGTVVAFVLFTEGVRLLGAARATAFTLLVPIFGVIASVLVLGERLRPLLLGGGAIVLAGLALVQRVRAGHVRGTVPAQGSRSGPAR
jgi:drug/metabolite transporter (DMT)-like permease